MILSLILRLLVGLATLGFLVAALPCAAEPPAASPGGGAPSVSVTELITQIDRALDQPRWDNRSRAVLRQWRDSATALQQWREELELRLVVAERLRQEPALDPPSAVPSPQELRGAWQSLRVQNPESASTWLQETQKALLQEQTKWTQMRSDAERALQDTTLPAVLSTALPPPPDPALATVAQWLEWLRADTVRLWQRTADAERRVAQQRLELAQRQLEKIDKAIAALEVVAPRTANADALQRLDFGRTLLERTRAWQEELDRLTATRDELRQRSGEIQRLLDGWQQEFAPLEVRLAAREDSPLLAFQLLRFKQSLEGERRESLRPALQRARAALEDWQRIEMALVQAQQRLEVLPQEFAAAISNTEVSQNEQPRLSAAFEAALRERRQVLNQIQSLRSDYLAAAAELERTALQAQRFLDEKITLIETRLLWARTAPPWWQAAGNELLALSSLVAQLWALPAWTWQQGMAGWAMTAALLLAWLGWFWGVRQRLEHRWGNDTLVNRLGWAALAPLGTLLGLLTAAQALHLSSHASHQALASALVGIAPLAWNLLFWQHALGRPGRLLSKLGWSENDLARWHRWMGIFAAVTLTSALGFAFAEAATATERYATTGSRTLLFALGVWLTFAFLFAQARLATDIEHRRPFRVILLVFAALAAMATLLSALGYEFSARATMTALLSTLWVALIAALVLSLGQRALVSWWQARQQSPAPTGTPQPPLGNATEPNTDTTAQNPANETSETSLRQARSLLTWTASLAALTALVWVWWPLVPALQGLEEWTLWRYVVVEGGERIEIRVSLADLLITLVAGALLWKLVRQAPALLGLLLARSALDAGARYAAVTLFRYVLIIIGMVWLLGRLGMPWSKLQWLVAALSVGLGFGLQEIVANFVSGLIILFERPIRVGDLVTIDTVTGRVVRMTIRATVIETADKQEVLIPNKAIITGRVTNWTLSDTESRITLPVGVAYGTDLTRVPETLLSAAREVPHIADDPAPSVAFVRFGESSVDFELRCFVADIFQRGEATLALALAVDRALHEAGIEIPFPQRDLHIKSVAPEVLGPFHWDGFQPPIAPTRPTVS